MRIREPQELFHFSCYHGAAGISRRNLVLPISLIAPDAAERVPQDWRWLTAYSWFTDLPQPQRLEVGLTSIGIHMTCDRMQYRFRVLDPAGPTWWPVALRGLRLDAARALSMTSGALPAHWWVSSRPVEVEAA